MAAASSPSSSIEMDVKTLEHTTLKVPYEVLNKKFRTTQKIFDREATYVCQAGSELEKYLRHVQHVGPLRDGQPGTSSGRSGSSGSDFIVRSEGASSEGPLLVESAINVQSIAALLASVEEGKEEPMMCDSSSSRHVSVLRKAPSAANIDGECEMEAEDSSSSRKGSDAENVVIPGGEGSGTGDAPATGHASRKNAKDVERLLDVLVERLGSLKRKAEDSIQEELQAADTVRKRVQHLKSFLRQIEESAQVDDEEALMAAHKGWKKSRLNRMLIDHLLREGMYDTARRLAEDLGIKDLTNVDVFWAAKEVEESLRRHETSRMVQWCYENKSKLRKIKSTLELEIRVQEFIELARNRRRTDAVKHARKYLADSDSEENMAAVKKCMGLLAYPLRTKMPTYVELLSSNRWDQLIAHFRQEHARLYQLAPNSVLEAAVQAGLAALKTPQCYRPETKNTNCPVCTDPLSALALHLPYAHCAHSQLVCAISGEPINENNPPLVLPSSFVYGCNALQDMAKNNSGKVVCPRSTKIFDLTQAEKVYVM